MSGGIAVRLMLGFLILLVFSGRVPAAEEAFPFGRFGTVTVYRDDSEPTKNVVLFVSGDGGWNQGVVDMARALAGPGVLVVGIDIVTYLKKAAAADDNCTYAPADLEVLSQFVQQKYGTRQYHRPVLVGYSSGATLVYTTLVQAPEGTFRGGISLGFCPDLRTGKPLCRQGGLVWTADPKLGAVYGPAAKLTAPWIALQGEIDEVCDFARTRTFIGKVGNAEMVGLPRVGHGYSVQRNWMPQFKEAFRRISEPPPAGERPPAGKVSDLPLTEVPARKAVPEGDVLAILVTGDGGWAGLDRDVAAALAERGIPVVGLDSLNYFWSARSPREAAADLDRIMAHYLAAWGKRKVVLVGYSFGADVLPFMIHRLPADRIARIAKAVLLAPSDTAEFEFHFANWVGKTSRNALPVAPEIEALEDLPLTCVFGTDDDGGLCRKLDGRNVTRVETKGGHHFGGDIAAIVKAITGPQQAAE